MNSNHSVRLGTSLTRTERNDMRRRFGASHAARTAKSLGPWAAAPCSCHGLTWSVSDLRYGWGATVADQTALCPLSN